jgi:glycosyltransferase involved in cell wall biosynthesis
MTEPNPVFFSVIVPCYNIGAYVGDTIESVRTQTFADWECLLSVEESTDDTQAICEAATKDPRFRVFAGEHSGSASVPRNRALDAARGVYVVWLDGDDLLTEGALERLAAYAREYGFPDMIESEMTERRLDGGGTILSTTPMRNFGDEAIGHVLSGEEAMVASARHTVDFCPSPGMATTRLDFVRANGLRFVPGLRFEDTEWLPRVLYAAKTVVPVDFVAQIYRHHPHSETTSNYDLSSLVAAAHVFGRLFRFHATHPFSPAHSRAWARSHGSHFLKHFFVLAPRAGIRGPGWTKAMGAVWKETGGRCKFLKLARFAQLPKLAAAPLVALCGIHPVLDSLAKFYFRRLYYPLVLRRELRRKK